MSRAPDLTRRVGACVRVVEADLYLAETEFVDRVDAGTDFLDVVSNLLHEFDKGVSIAVDLPYPNANAGQSARSSQTRYDDQR